MADFEKNIPPRIYHIHDPDGILGLWKEMVELVMEDERIFAAKYQEIVDPDTAPMIFVELMLRQLGNPFSSVFLSDTQKRKLAKLLIPIYRQKGIGKGIINAYRFLTGIEVTITDPHASAEDSWEVGISEVGLSTYVGGGRVYCNLLNYSQNFSAADWVKSSASVTPGGMQGPPPFYGAADTFNLATPGASVAQTVTPLQTAGDRFTGSVWLKAASSGSVKLQVYSVTTPSDFKEVTVAVTTSWQRFDLTHQFLNTTYGAVGFKILSSAGFAPALYAFGAQLVRYAAPQPYYPTLADGADCNHPGKWVYHFFINALVDLTEEEERILRVVADYIKPAHTHYTIIDENDIGFIDHWEVGISRIGIETFVHA